MAPTPRTLVTWTLSIVLGAAFLMSGSGKLMNTTTAEGIDFDRQFELWGFPSWFRFPVGIAEIAGAIGLLVPRLRFYAATGLSLLMVGATLTHLRLGEFQMAPFPLTLGVLVGVLAWTHRPAWVHRRLRSASPA